MKYLTQVVETYRVDNEDLARDMIEEAKNDSSFTLTKYASQYKERKAKGEVIDAWFKVTLTKVFNDERDPEENVTITYTR